MLPLFVYGSLKEGFPNFRVNRGRRLPGEYRTATPYPLMLLDGVLPCLFARPGEGLVVVGQLFEVDAAALAAMDALERVGEPGGYERLVIGVQRADVLAAEPVEAFVYVGGEALVARAGAHVGPLAEYTLQHARTLRW
jgi:gamma-glutamylaminecyclotransferase